MQVLKYLKKLFAQPSVLELATQEIAIAEREKMEAETALDYARSIVDYNNARIKRLNNTIETYFQENSK